MTNTHVQPVVLRYKKSSSARWLSHLDLIRVLERAMRRAQLPIMYSQGFNPRPRMSFGPPLPLGATSDGEVLALRLSGEMEPSDIKQRLNSQLPEGIQIVDVKTVAENQPVMEPIHGCVYVLRVVCRTPTPVASCEEAVKEFVGRNEVIVERPDKRFTKRVDIRPSVQTLEVVGSDAQTVSIRVGISHSGQTGAKPVEVAQALSKPGRDIEIVSLHRESFY